MTISVVVSESELHYLILLRLCATPKISVGTADSCQSTVALQSISEAHVLVKSSWQQTLPWNEACVMVLQGKATGKDGPHSH